MNRPAADYTAPHPPTPCPVAHTAVQPGGRAAWPQIPSISNYYQFLGLRGEEVVWKGFIWKLQYSLVYCKAGLMAKVNFFK